MKKLVSLSLCLSLGFFALARAMKPVQTLAAVAETAQNKPTGEKADAKTLVDDVNTALAAMIKAASAGNESSDMSETEEQEVAAEDNNDEEEASDEDDRMEDASDDEGQDMSDDDASDDNGGDDDSGDEGD